MTGDEVDLEICGRCLVQPDTRSVVRAITSDSEYIAPNTTNPRALRDWAIGMLYGSHARFQINATADRLKAVSTWHGDPVCSWHLWQLAEAEMRRGYA